MSGLLCSCRRQFCGVVPSHHLAWQAFCLLSSLQPVIRLKNELTHAEHSGQSLAFSDRQHCHSRPALTLGCCNERLGSTVWPGLRSSTTHGPPDHTGCALPWQRCSCSGPTHPARKEHSGEVCHSCVLLGSHSGSVLGKQLALDASEEAGSVRAGPETCLPQEPSARGSTLAACPVSMSEPTWPTLLYCGADQPLLATTACTLP